MADSNWFQKGVNRYWANAHQPQIEDQAKHHMGWETSDYLMHPLTSANIGVANTAAYFTGDTPELDAQKREQLMKDAQKAIGSGMPEPGGWHLLKTKGDLPQY